MNILILPKIDELLNQCKVINNHYNPPPLNGIWTSKKPLLKELVYVYCVFCYLFVDIIYIYTNFQLILYKKIVISPNSTLKPLRFVTLFSLSPCIEKNGYMFHLAYFVQPIYCLWIIYLLHLIETTFHLKFVRWLAVSGIFYFF